MAINEIPNEIIDIIINYNMFEELYNYLFVNKQYYGIVQNICKNKYY